MGRQILCLSCQHLEQYDVEAYLLVNPSGYQKGMEDRIAYLCLKTCSAIRLLRTECKNYLPIQQTKINIKEDGSMKVDEIPTEAERIDLNALPDQIELLAIDEKTVQPSSGKTGGIVITFQLRDGRQFPQKYSKVSATELVKALKKLKVEHTSELFNNWFLYKLTPMRIGFPRMIPIKKVKE